MAELVDQYGRPIDLSMLRQEQAAAQLAGVRHVQTGHPAQGLTPQRLASLLRHAEDGDAAGYLELAEEMEERDLHYLSVMSTRKRQVSQLNVTVEAASDEKADVENAEFVREWLARDELEDDLFDILDAVGKGYSATEIIWDFSSSQWWPARLEFRDPRWFEFNRVDGRTPMLRDIGTPQPLAPYKWIFHRHKAKSGTPIRGGLARPVAWAYLFKNFAVKDWVQFVEVYGLPLRIGRYGPSATKDDIKTLMRAVAGISVDAAAVIPASMQIEFQSGKSGSSGDGADVFLGLANFLDQQVSKAVLGQTATTDAIAGGHAVGQEHNDVRGDIQRSDARQLAGSLNRDLVHPLITLNKGPQKRYPRICIGLDEQVDIVRMSAALAQLVPLGLRVEASQVRDRLGFADPARNAEVLAPPSARIVEPDPVLSQQGQRLMPGGPCPVHAQEDHAHTPDAIDQFIHDVLEDDWAPLMEPLRDGLEALLTGAQSLEDVRDGLASALTDMDVTAFAELLARGGFAARLAGATGAPLSDV